MYVVYVPGSLRSKRLPFIDSKVSLCDDCCQNNGCFQMQRLQLGDLDIAGAGHTLRVARGNATKAARALALAKRKSGESLVRRRRRASSAAS